MSNNNSLECNAPGAEDRGISLLRYVKEGFVPDRRDGIFALAVFVVGFLFTRWVWFSWQGWGVTVFTFVYCGTVMLYFHKKGVLMAKAGWFWLGAIILTALSYSLWTNNGLEPWRSMFLFCGAVYWVMCAADLLTAGKTSDWMCLDFLSGLVIIPGRYFWCQYKSIAFLGSGKRGKVNQALSIVLGIFLAFAVGCMVLPLLLEADSGGFASITNGVLLFFKELPEELAELLAHGILTVPAAAYLFGLVAGGVHRRGSSIFHRNAVEIRVSSLRVLPPATVYTLLGLLCCLYVIFIASQLPYFFSAFAGARPEGWLVYSEYARRGFFELCGITAINLSVLTAANLLSVKQRKDSIVLRAINCLLALLTLVLIAAALSKMALYIGVYGLTVRRMLPSVFMVFLAVVLGGVIALQKWQFSIVRLAAGVGVVMLCTLCLSNPDSLVVRYNTNRYLSGTLERFDVGILYTSGPAGVASALELYDRSDDSFLKNEIRNYLLGQQNKAMKSSQETEYNLEKVMALQKIAQKEL